MPQYSGIFSLPQQAQAITSGQWCTDPLFKNTTLLLRADGSQNAYQNNTFLDASANSFTVNVNASPSQGSYSPYLNLWSNFFDGSGDSLTCSATATQLSGDFTIECWVNWSNVGGSGWRTIISNYTGWTSGAFFLAMAGTDGVNFGSNNTGDHIYSGSGKLPMDVWNHVAVVRSGSTITIYANGVSVGSFTDSTNYTLSQGTFIGKSDASGNTYYGYISNLRVVKGVAVYTSNFTPSAIPLTAVSGTSLLTCQSNRFIDNSSNNFAVSRSGDVKVSRLSPFAPQSSYIPSTIGGSVYLSSSTSDYLYVNDSAALRPGTSAFTIQAWVYKTGSASTDYPIMSKGTSGGATGFYFFLSGSSLRFIYNGTSILHGGFIPSGQWTHVAAVRTSTATNGFQLYINGAAMASPSTVSANFTETNTLYVGADSGTAAGNLYISNLSYVIGAAETITVPTSPITANANTRLLLNFTNAGIYDSTMTSNLATMGNAQISTSIKKYGTGSLSFDGTGDYLTLASNDAFGFGTGDFTIEAWVNPSTTGVKVIYADNGSTRITCSILYVAGEMSFYDNVTVTVVSSSGANISTNAWTHVAWVRASGVLKMFANGVQVYSATKTSNFGTPTGGFVGSNISAGDLFVGYIDDLRITKGVARYVSNFTPPTVALPVQ